MKKYLTLFKKIAQHELINGSFYIFIGGLIASVLAFLLNIYFARSLSYQDYGTLNALITIEALLMIPAGSISAIIARYATAFFAKKENSRAGAFYRKTFKGLLVLSGILIVVFFLISNLILKFLQIEQTSLILIAIFSVVIYYLSTLNMAFIQSLLKFKTIGAINVISGLAKLLSGVIFVFLGLNVYGALISTLVFSIINFIASLIPIRHVIAEAGDKVDIGVKDFTKYAVPTTISLFFLSLFVSNDVLFVKHYFSSVEAGLYSGLALVGRVIFYFTGPIAIAMFPLIVKNHAMNKKYQHLFHLSILLVLIPSVAITAFYFLFPDFVIKIFLGGNQYYQMAKYLGIYGIFITLFSVNNVFVNFFLSIKKTFVAYFVFAFAILQMILIFIFHSNIYQIIFASIISSVLLLISLLLYYLWTNKFNAQKA